MRAAVAIAETLIGLALAYAVATPVASGIEQAFSDAAARLERPR